MLIYLLSLSLSLSVWGGWGLTSLFLSLSPLLPSYCVFVSLLLSVSLFLTFFSLSFPFLYQCISLSFSVSLLPIFAFLCLPHIPYLSLSLCLFRCLPPFSLLPLSSLSFFLSIPRLVQGWDTASSFPQPFSLTRPRRPTPTNQICDLIQLHPAKMQTCNLVNITFIRGRGGEN